MSTDSESWPITPAQWATLRTRSRAGKSWAPWLILLREQLRQTPEQELRSAVLWAMRDEQGKHPPEIFAGPRVFPG